MLLSSILTSQMVICSFYAMHSAGDSSLRVTRGLKSLVTNTKITSDTDGKGIKSLEDYKDVFISNTRP